ncbi:leucine-rich repeat neuronal protein 4 [Cololabis saira]|uniref:leucine-rich repeat neuronal protein 4 n=1 Tax=Cololabis saira TaxID=129043 RepID=UPI002AD41BB3|nr:leucine-rich repeat neuronal protein 4 [Cololabis saira]
MASLPKNQAALLLFASLVIHFHLFIHAASTSPPVTHKRTIIMTAFGSDDDYDEDDYGIHSPPPKVFASVKTPLLRSKPMLCVYNPCLEKQDPCERLSAETGCLCPGMSGSDEPPHPPRIQALTAVSEGNNIGKIEVQWCAPSSVVTSYKVVVEGASTDAVEYGNDSRRGYLGSLEVGTRVCVEAVNSAGLSGSSEFSCKRYEHTASSGHNLLVWVIVGGVALLLLLVITSVILWRYQMCQRAKRHSADGLGNPSYSTERTL